MTKTKIPRKKLSQDRAGVLSIGYLLMLVVADVMALYMLSPIVTAASSAMSNLTGDFASAAALVPINIIFYLLTIIGMNAAVLVSMFKD